MSWLSEFANRAENLLNTLDKTAAEALREVAQVPSTSASFPVSEQEDDLPSADRFAPVTRQSELRTLQNGVHKPPEDIFVQQAAWEDVAGVRTRDTPQYSSTTTHAPKSSKSRQSVPVKAPVPHRTGVKRSDEKHKSTAVSSSSGYLSGAGGGSGSSETASTAATSTLDLEEGMHQETSKLYLEEGMHQETSKPVSTTVRIEGGSQSDIRLENKLLRSEISSLGQEVSDLLKRNHRTADENKQLRGQVERLTNQLRDSDARVRELQVKVRELTDSQWDAATHQEAKLLWTEAEQELTQNLAVLGTERDSLQRELDTLKHTLTSTSTALHQSRHQTSLIEKRAELAQREVARVTRDLTEYKEKATHILQLKEQLIASLRGEAPTSDNRSDDSNLQRRSSQSQANCVLTEELTAVRAECDMLRQESAKWQIEVDNRQAAVQDLELQMQAELQAFRRDLDLAGQWAEREGQLREAADGEIVQLRHRLLQLKAQFDREKAELHAQLTASQTEVTRLLNRSQTQFCRSQSTSPDSGSSRSESTDDRLVATEARLRQLADSLLVKQEALDSVLAQNHALKIRLERCRSDNESLAEALSAEAYRNGSSALPLPVAVTNAYGCARLSLQRSSVPYALHPALIRLDSITCRLTNGLRRVPLLRIFLLIYLVLLHVWLLLASAIFLPTPPTLPGPSPSAEMPKS